MTTSDPQTFERELDISFDKMAAILPEATEKALNVGAYILKDAVKTAFSTTVPNSTKPISNQTINGRYQITKGDSMIDAVRQSRVNRMTNSTRVHILGTKESGSGQFIARFYESGTKPRYAKTYRGVKLKKKHATGEIKGYHFFFPAIESTMNEATQAMANVLDNKINAAINNG